MSNKLKEMLNPKNNGLELTFSFESASDRANFIDAVNASTSSGVPQEVPLPRSVELKIKAGDYEYPYEETENIVAMKVYPLEDLVEIPIVVDGNGCKYTFLRRIVNNVAHLNSKNSKVIDVTIEFNAIEHLMNFSYASHPENADSIEELLWEYKCFLSLLDYLFQNNSVCERLEDTKKYFNQALKAYCRAMELSRALSIQLTPKMMLDEDDKNLLIEKMYLLLVKNSIIRQDDKLNSTEMAHVENMEVGQTLFATFFQENELKIYGETRAYYTVNCIFGAIIEKVEASDDGNYIVYFKESETRPMYRSYSAFLDEKSAEEEINNIMGKIEQYEHAINWNDQLKKLLQS